MRIFVFGNGLSVASTNGKANVSKITRDLWDWLEQEGIKGFVENLQAWARPQLSYLDPQAHNDDFEVVAGSLHRLSQALTSLTSLADLESDATDGLLEASTHLRRLYRRVVAYVLLQVDRAARGDRTGADSVNWADLNAMASSLLEAHNTQPVAIYTLNYDSLLMSALLEQSNSFVYDGFRGKTFNWTLDPRGSISLYPLHGSIGMYTDKDGTLRKRPLSQMRKNRVLEKWISEEDHDETPRVILGDTKDSLRFLEPFSSYYNRLEGDLLNRSTQEVVVGGYGFGDVPLNRALGLFLAAHPNNRLRDWRPTATANVDIVLKELQDPLPRETGAKVKREQIIGENVNLPNSQAVKSLNA